MVSNVTILPIGEDRFWRKFSSVMDDDFRAHGLPEQMRIKVSQSVRNAFFSYCRNKLIKCPCPDGGEEAIVAAAKKVENHFQEMIGALLLQIASREIELYLLKEK